MAATKSTKSTKAGDEEEPESPEVVEPEVDPRLITALTKDYMGLALADIETAAVDYLGRACITGDKDYMGRGLVA